MKQLIRRSLCDTIFLLLLVVKTLDYPGLEKLFFKYFFRQYLLLSLVIIWPFLKASSQEYFQQEVNYKINVTLNDKNHELNGFESVEYINNSPDTLSFLYFHLWPNAYSDNKTELAKQIFSLKGKGKLFNDPELRGYIDSLDFKEEDHLFNGTYYQDLPIFAK